MTLRQSEIALCFPERKHSPAPTSEGAGRKSVLGRSGKSALGTLAPAPKLFSDFDETEFFITLPSELHYANYLNRIMQSCQGGKLQGANFILDRAKVALGISKDKDLAARLGVVP